MATILQQGAVSAPATPRLDIWTLVAGRVADVFALGFRIVDDAGAQVFPGSGIQAVDVDGADHLGLGHYVASWTVPGAQSRGRYVIEWYVTPVDGGAVLQQLEDFEVVPSTLRVPTGPMYVSLSDLRDEGFLETSLSDARALKLISYASRMLEKWTRRFFEPRFATFTFDGSAGASQYLDSPIIALSTLGMGNEDIAPDSYQIYNRHITQGLLDPDDRQNPKITFTARINIWYRHNFQRSIFWEDAQNVAVSGVFGYTDPDPNNPLGVTPEAIKRIIMMIVAREQVPIGDIEGRVQAQSVSRVRDMRTRDQSISYGAGRSESMANGGAGDVYTGDPAIDDLIAEFRPPPYVGVA